MGLDSHAVVVDERGGAGKTRVRRKKKDAMAEETGCWIKFISMGSCISSRSKVDSSLSSGCSNYGKPNSPFCPLHLLSSALSTASMLKTDLFLMIRTYSII